MGHRRTRAGSITRPALLTVFTTVVLVLMLCPRGMAAPAWLSSTNLSVSGQSATEPQLAIDGQGDVTAVWTRSDGTNTIAQAATRPAGLGAWQAPVSLSAPGEPAEEPQIASASDGQAIAVWERFNGSNWIVQAAVLSSANGTWQAPVDLSAPGQNAAWPHVGIDGHGNATAVWERFDGSNWIVQATRHASGTWQAPVNISTPGADSIEPEVAVGVEGDAVTAWANKEGAHYAVQAATRTTSNGAWQAPVSLSAAGLEAGPPQLGIGDGKAIVVWERSAGSYSVVESTARLLTSSEWKTPVFLSLAGVNSANPQVAVSADGKAVAIWQGYDGSNFTAEASIRHSSTEIWDLPEQISEPGQEARGPHVAIDPAGNATAVWVRSNGSNTITQASTKSTFGEWKPPADLSPSGHDAFEPRIASDDAGDAVAAWTLSSEGQYVIQAAGHDAAGPTLESLSIPSTGTVGVPLSFSVEPLDLWSPIGSNDWTFDDGALGSGATVAHTYTVPGDYHVTLLSSDLLGNTTSVSRDLTVVPAAATLGPAPIQGSAPAPSQPITPPSAPAYVGPPVISGLRQSHTQWQAGTAIASISRKGPPLGTAFSFTLNEPARVELIFTSVIPGRIVAGRCVSESSIHGGRSCTRRRSDGALSFAAHGGANTISFQGRISSSKTLQPGQHLLSITARDSAGRHASAGPLGFTVLR